MRRALLKTSYHFGGTTTTSLAWRIVRTRASRDVVVGLLQGQDGLGDIVDTETVCALPFAMLVFIPNFDDHFAQADVVAVDDDFVLKTAARTGPTLKTSSGLFDMFRLFLLSIGYTNSYRSTR